MLGKKSSEKSAKNVFLYSHEYRELKMGGKTRETIFPETRIIRAKNVVEKNCRKKLRKTFFYIHTDIVTRKWGEKNSRNNFSRNTRIVREKMFGKKSSENSAKNVF